MAIEYSGIDSVSGKYRYYDTAANVFNLSDEAPSSALANAYKRNNPGEPVYLTDISSTTVNAAAGQAADVAVENTVSTTENKLSLDESSALSSSKQPPVYTVDQLNRATPLAEDAQEYDDYPSQAQINAGRANAEDTSKLTSVTKTTSQVAVSSASNIQPMKQTPVDNPLHSYATYTYSISLFILSKDEHNTLSKNPEKFTPRNCLISSGGKHGMGFPRQPRFADDFYFDNLRMTTVIGLNNQSKSSNAIDLSFTIIEPYGLTLLDRIIAASKDVGSPNYLEMPYFLQIDFYGNDDAGKVLTPIPGQTKKIPIKLIDMKIRVSTRGSEYQIKAVPFNHQAFQQTATSTPINMEVDAKTVGDFFVNSDTAEASASSYFDQKAVDDKERAEKEKNKTPTDEKDARSPGQGTAAATKTATSPYKSNSYTSAVNAWFKHQVKTGSLKHPNSIKFNVDPAIINSTIVAPAKTDVSKTPTTNPGTKEHQAVNKPGGVGPDNQSSSFAVNAGTSILTVIDQVMRNSSYITSQLKDPAVSITDPQQLATVLNKPLNWYKVVPSVELKQFDENTNKWSTEVTYHIKPYTVYDSKHPFGPQSKPTGAVKQYDYIYTGKNRDIIDFNIDFDTAYFTSVTLNRSRYQEIETQSGKTEDDKNNIKNPSGGKNSAFPRVVQGISDNQAAYGMDGNRSSITKTAADVQTSVYSSSRGDMLNVKMKIVGDPHMIKQDDVLTNPSGANYKSQIVNQIMPGNGSVQMDSGEIFAKITFKTPTDLDEKTGLVRMDGTFKETVFSGYYRFLTVDNDFRGGRFEQTCNLVRIFDDLPGSSKTSGNARPASTTSNSTVRTPLAADKELPPPAKWAYEDVGANGNSESIENNDEDRIRAIAESQGQPRATTVTTPDMTDEEKIRAIAASQGQVPTPVTTAEQQRLQQQIDNVRDATPIEDYRDEQNSSPE